MQYLKKINREDKITTIVNLHFIDMAMEYADRIIDIDILLFGQRIIDTEKLRIPHPRMNERLFVLLPLAEIAPSLRHPESGSSIRELRDLCKDPSPIRRL